MIPKNSIFISLSFSKKTKGVLKIVLLSSGVGMGVAMDKVKSGHAINLKLNESESLNQY